MTLVLAHDYLTEAGGAERVVSALAAHHPDAPLLTSAVRRETLDAVLSAHEIRTGPLGGLLADKRRARMLFPLLPVAFRLMRVPRGDALLTSSSGFAHHLRPPPGMVHVWYCHTPPRFLWDAAAYFRDRPRTGAVLGPTLAVLRWSDRRAAARVDLVIANSAHTADRIRTVYGRIAPVVWPPVPVDRFQPTSQRSGRLLVVSRLLGYKRIEVAIEAAGIAGVGLDVVGDGPDRVRLERLAGPGVRFLGRLTDEQVAAHLARCLALVVPGVEDFGISVVEAQASGRPPIVLAAGGALETVEDGVTGIHVPSPDPALFATAIRMAGATTWDPEALRGAARRLDTPRFLARIDGLVADAIAGRAAA